VLSYRSDKYEGNDKYLMLLIELLHFLDPKIQFFTL
jgi:hypothetical protein